MLAPDSRTVAVDLLRPPPGFELDVAVLTTYSLDLETVLALPLAVLAQAEHGVEALLEDPLMLIRDGNAFGISRNSVPKLLNERDLLVTGDSIELGGYF